ncbi:MAG: hypothetical protein ACO1PZ_07045 [Gammaproteobacteria bacterium]
MIKPEKIQQELETWEGLIGKFMIACGNIEKATYEILLILPSDDLSNLIIKLGLVARIDLIIELLPQRIKNADLVTGFTEKLHEVKSKIGLRNTIAHNPVDLSLFDSAHGITTRQVVSKFHPDIEKMRKTEVDVFEMEERCTEMQFLASRIVQYQYSVERYLSEGA